MELLDDFSGFEFEDLMEDVFRNLGYENVRQSTKTGDEGRDILMEEVVDGQRRAVVVECKHTDTVGRPVVQKLHSAVATFSHSGPKRGIVITTGRFTNPAEEYARDLQRNGDPYQIELIDGTELREIAEEVGLDLYNGRIEVLCEETLRPFDPASGVDAPITNQFQDIENIEQSELSDPYSQATLQPVLQIDATVDAVFETTVGVVHQVNERASVVVSADRGQPTTADEEVQTLVNQNRHTAINIEQAGFEEHFDSHETKRFGQTETEYKDWIVDRLRDNYTTTVEYTGDNNVTYTKECEPKQSDISVTDIDPVYLPRIRQTLSLQSYDYPYAYFAAGPSRCTIEDGIHECVHCGEENASTFTFCANCGSINCGTHTKTERIEQEPICTGCAVTERFALRTKYFYDDENLATFREQYEEMPFYEKAMENMYLVGSVLGVVLLALMSLFTIGPL